ncbi:DUF5134 domain-containing protein [Streptomyces tauricus]|uniref:DUF5134 domain-containing protein n=1 Tax=Streptomyces tauricus TaxID=68274 RepID=UPI00341919FB
MLTLLFVLVAAHELRHVTGASVPGHRDRVDHLLHAAMALAMAAMPWSLGRALPEDAMTALFAAAALWFPLAATGRRTAHRALAIADRLPYAAAMAAMVWMLRTRHDATGPAATITVVLALYLLVCALRSLTRPMPALGSAGSAARYTAARSPVANICEGAMALGTAVMLLMPH